MAESVSDNVLVEKAREGDSRAFEMLIIRYKDKGMTLAVRLLGRREDAEEVLQDAFVRTFHGLSRFRGDSKFGTWFYRILHNQCMTRIGQLKSKQNGNFTPLDESHVDSIPDEGLLAFDRMDERELHLAVKDEIQNLPAHLKSAITLFYLEDLSYEEVSEALALPLGTTKTHLFRGRQLLRDRIAHRFGQEVNTE